jgi:hypothetical protein
MSIQKMDGETVREQWREWIAAAGAGKTDVIVVVEGQETAAIIAYRDYLALRDELVKLRADRKKDFDDLAIAASLDYLTWEAELGDDDGDEGGDDGD